MGDVEKFVHSIPKIELHCHLLGSVRRETFADLAQAARAPIGSDTIAAYYARQRRPAGVLPILRTIDRHLIRRPDDLHRVTLEYLLDAAAHQVRYTEFFWNPTGTAQASGIAYPQALAAIVRGIQDAQRQCGIIGRLVPAIDREASPAAAQEMVEWVATYRADEVVGIGIDYGESGRPPELFADAYARARRAGLRTTAHAGEFGLPWQHVRTALELLRVDRVDHGYSVVDNPELAARCAERGVVFTVVPRHAHYRHTLAPERWADEHPIRRMRALGLRLHPNTDDPALQPTTPTGAWLAMARDLGFSTAELRACMLNGIDGAWLDEGTRARWRREWAEEFDRLAAA